jgi:hypothetical protein
MPNAKRTRHKDRVVLSDEALSKVESILEDLKVDLKGAKITRSELVNWIMERQPNELPSSDRSKILERFYCPVKALEWAYAKAKSMKLGGQQVELEKIVSEVLNQRPKANIKKRKIRP